MKEDLTFYLHTSYQLTSNANLYLAAEMKN